MANDNFADRITALKDRAASAEQRRVEAETKVTVERARLVKAIADLQSFGVSSVEDARKKLEELNRMVDENISSAEKVLEEIGL